MSKYNFDSSVFLMLGGGGGPHWVAPTPLVCIC